MGKLIKYAKPYWWQSLICPFLMTGEVILELLIPLYMSKIVDVGIPNGDMHYVLVTGGKMLVIAGCSLFCGAMAARLSAVASMGLGARVREAMYKNIQTFSFSNIDRFSTASLVTRMTNDVTTVQNMYQMLLRIFFRAPLQFICAMFMSFKINHKVSSVFLVVIPLILVVLAIFGPIAMKRFKKMFTMLDNLNGSVQENLIAIRVVKAFVRGDYEKAKFKKSNDDLTAAAVSAEMLMVSAQPAMMLLMYGTILAISFLASKYIVAGEMQIGEFSMILTYIMQILMSVVMMAMMLVNFVMSRAAASRIQEVLDETPDINDDAANLSLKVENGAIEFCDVCFKYNKDGEKNVVDHADFKIRSGETVGIIGGTGSAKTTLVSLIPRLYDVTTGEVRVAGHNVKNYTIEELRESVSMVLQNNVLFSGTIAENLRWGDENATDEELVAACKSAQAHDFISSFPDGYQTDLGQGGVNVSGGQKQRLCIARALLKKPKILILDDSTSAVDTFTDSKIREAFKNDIPNTTKIIIAQRISSVQDADKIIVLDNGKIADMGTHEELLERSPIYSEVYYSQQKGVVAEGGEG
ncbi:MAG: ABC transporter ATP-binding protein/permease [Ruminococcus sp.]|nr:ABC transporter ATP-binding protein/permease [Ruminococcus sp.]